MKNILKLIICVLASTLLFGCASEYGPLGLNGGYKEEKLKDGTYDLHFFGSSHTKKEVVGQMLYKRAAELTQLEGRRFFLLTNIRLEEKNVVVESEGSPATDKKITAVAISGQGYAPVEHKNRTKYIGHAILKTLATDEEHTGVLRVEEYK